MANALAILGLASLCQTAAAASYWVSPSGSDANSGAPDSPFRTVAKATSWASPGDTIILKDGTYGNEGQASDGSGGMHGYATPVTISTSGSPDAWITLKAEHQWQANLDCGTSGDSLGCDKYIYLATGAAYWSFEDLIFSRGAFGAIGTDVGASHIKVKGCFFMNIGLWNNPTQIGEDGIGFDHTATDWWIEGNMFTSIGRNGGTDLDHGIYAAGSNVTIVNNLFFNLTHGWAIQLADGATNWVIANNTFGFPNPSVGGQIVMWNRSTNITIENNIFYNPLEFAINRVTSYASGCIVDHNIIYGTSTVMLYSSGCSVGSNMLGTDPQFVSAVPPYNFRLQATSPAIGAGVSIPGITADFDGTPRPLSRGSDIGAFGYPDNADSAPSSASPSSSAAIVAPVSDTAAVPTAAASAPTQTADQIGY